MSSSASCIQPLYGDGIEPCPISHANPHMCCLVLKWETTLHQFIMIFQIPAKVGTRLAQLSMIPFGGCCVREAQ